MSTLSVEVPRPLKPFLQPSRYKAAYGGRGGGKSHFFAEQIILQCFRKKTRVACIREVQATIKDSVRQLLIDKISKFGLEAHFKVKDGEIEGPRGSLIIFKGMQSYNAENIKSLEGFDLAWVEEAQTLSARSLRLLRPTIRKEGSEIWFSWNPRHEMDAVDEFFRGKTPPSNAIICPVGWADNPWFTGVLVEEKDQDYAADSEMAEHVWGGGYEIITEAAYYAKWVRAAEKEGRVGYFPPNPALPVVTGWDLGVDDYTAIWFAQIIQGKTLRVVDYYETDNMGAEEIIADTLPEYVKDELERNAKMQEIGRPFPFRYGMHYYPHDIAVREWGAGARTRIDSLIQLGIPQNTIHRGVATNNEDRVQAVRMLLPNVEFHQTERVMKGVNRLRRYRRKYNELMGTYVGPLKDGNDHGADAFGEMAINCGIRPAAPRPTEKPKPQPGQVVLGPPETAKSTRISL